ncbi:glycosyltransferase family 39 protein [Listeria valentina]|uniref:glycosyltransferase family 39 protein n=1 Tax=Listeria valentina TaxID=2705293 RepID=UPI0014322DBB|nr:glycosyltransferase family 39 protein [Listeria valentina]
MFRRVIGYSFTSAFVIVIAYLAYLSTAHPLMELISNPFNLFLFALTAVFLFLAVFKGLTLLSQKANWIIFIALVAVVVIIQLFLAITMKMNMYVDSFVVKQQVLTMLANGGHFQDYTYFQTYLNNIFVTILRYGIYNFGSHIGIQNFYLLDNLWIMFSMFVTIFALVYVVKDALGVRMANLFLLVVITCVPLFTYTLYIYTDTIAMPFVSLIILVYYLYLKKGSWWLLLIIGLLFAIGYQAKPNLIILLPALLIHVWLVKNYKKFLLSFTAIGAVFLLVTSAAMPFYSLFGFEKNDRYEVPPTHFVMMGLAKPAGRYNADEFDYTSSFHSKEAKKEANVKVIKDRLKNYSTKELLTLYNNKLKNTWTDGTRAYAWYINSTNDFTPTFNYLFGDRKALIYSFAQVFHIMSLLCIAIGALRFFRSKKFDFAFFLNVTLIGVILFHLIWEANQRYILLFTPLMLLSALYGIKFIVELMADRETNNWLPKLRRPFLAGSAFIFLAAIVCFGLQFSTLAQEKRPFHVYQVKQDYAYIGTPVMVDSIVAETFSANESFNQLTFRVLQKPDDSRKYRIALYDDTSGKKLRQFDLKGSEFIGPNQVINLAKPVHADGGRYKLKFTEITKGDKGHGHALSLGRYNSKNFSLYPAGQLYVNGKVMKHTNIGFTVSTFREQPLLSVAEFWMLFAAFASILMGFWLCLLKESPAGRIFTGQEAKEESLV